jgi:hypothetical protein
METLRKKRGVERTCGDSHNQQPDLNAIFMSVRAGWWLAICTAELVLFQAVNCNEPDGDACMRLVSIIDT